MKVPLAGLALLSEGQGFVTLFEHGPGLGLDTGAARCSEQHLP